MKYLCLIYYPRRRSWTPCRPSEYDALVGEHFAYDEELRKSGHFIVAARRCSRSRRPRPCGSGTARCPRPTVRSPRRRSSSAASILIEARDLNDAIQVAAEDSRRRASGSIEVRPIAELAQP